MMPILRIQWRTYIVKRLERNLSSYWSRLLPKTNSRGLSLITLIHIIKHERLLSQKLAADEPLISRRSTGRNEFVWKDRQVTFDCVVFGVLVKSGAVDEQVGKFRLERDGSRGVRVIL